MATDGQYDPKEIKVYKDYALHLKSIHSQRNAILDKMEKMFLLLWDDENRTKRNFKNTRITKSPDARNKLMGAIRLLIASDPIFSSPFDSDEAGAEQAASKLEEYAATCWKASGRVRGDPVHYDVIRSALLFDEFFISINDTKEMVQQAVNAPKASRMLIEDLAEQTPFLFDAVDPRTCYPDYSPYGMRAILHESDMLVQDVWETFEDGKLVLPEDKYKPFDSVTVSSLWDTLKQAVFIKSIERPLYFDNHDLAAIPWVGQRVEGSRIFSKREYQYQPFLYTLWKSGIWDNENLLLTVLYTQIFAIGANAMFVEKLNQQGKGVNVDFGSPGGKVTVPYGADWAPVANKGVIDPSVITGLDLGKNASEESTIYSQTLGEPLSANAPFSMVALLNQAGRLPLTVPQRKGGWGIADAVKTALRIQKDKGRQGKARYENKTVSISAGDIPKYIAIDARLDISLPQDKLQAATVADKLSSGEHPLVSREWAQENLLQIGQSDKMERAIMDEQAGWLHFQKYVIQQMAELEQLKRLVMSPTPPGGMQQGVPQQQVPPGGGEQMPPGSNGQMPPELAAAGQPPMMGPMQPGPEGNMVPPESLAQGGD